MKFSKRAMKIQPSATLSIGALAAKLKAEGKPVVSFSQGEPDFTSPPAVMDAARAAIDRGETHYTVCSGIPELKSEIGAYYERRFGLKYANDSILVSSGAKPLLYEACQVLVDPGDEVLVFAPAWVSYVEQIRQADGEAVVVETADTGFEPTAERIEAAIGPRTVGMIINTPNNPTGRAYSADTLRAIAEAARAHDLWIVFDEIYERLVYGAAKHVNILDIAPDIADRVIIINGVSKALCMTGWRIGYALGPAATIKKFNDLQSHMLSNASSIAQWAALGGLRGADGDIERCRAEFDRRRGIAYGLLKEIKGLKIEEPTGAFYAFFDVRGTKEPDDVKFCERLLAEELVAMVPGSAFLAPGFVRMSYACSEEDIREGIARLKKMVESM